MSGSRLATIAPTNNGLVCTPEHYALATDLYQLTMAACYVQEQIATLPASFELTVRRLPSGFGYLIAMGLAQVLDYLEHLAFSDAQIQYLQATGLFDHAPQAFWTLLEAGRFTGEVWAVPEGTPIFPNEPLLRIEAPLWQAQLVETYLLNTINYQTLIATKAARLRDIVAPDAMLLEFGTRRAFSPQASLWAARAALAAGFNATSNVLAAQLLETKPAGTMAHSLVMALAATEGTEMDAFQAFLKTFPANTLLVDTFNTYAAIDQLAEQVNRNQMVVNGIRIDSGDLVALSQYAREKLPEALIVASGDLDEAEILRLNQQGACLDAYGIGTKLVTGTPVNGVYKLVELDGIPVMKQSPDKITLPGRKQIFRQFADSQLVKDRLGLKEESAEPGESALLHCVMRGRNRLLPPESISQIAQRTRHNVEQLPMAIRQIQDAPAFPVEQSATLQALIAEVQQGLATR
jgi:nicotinate phosphoribosyltransferase